MFWIRDMMIREVSTYFYCHVSETKWALQYDWSKINIRSKFDPSVRRRVVRWTFLQHGISLTPCWGSIMAMRWTTFYHHSVDCNHGYHRCFFIISLFIEQMDFRLSWLALSTHCTTTCRVQTRLKRKHRNPTKIPPGTNSLSRAGAPGVVDERGREDLRGGGQVNISSSTTKIFYIGSSNQRWCRGPVYSLTIPQVFITI